VEVTLTEIATTGAAWLSTSAEPRDPTSDKGPVTVSRLLPETRSVKLPRIGGDVTFADTAVSVPPVKINDIVLLLPAAVSDPPASTSVALPAPETAVSVPEPNTVVNVPTLLSDVPLTNAVNVPLFNVAAIVPNADATDKVLPLNCAVKMPLLIAGTV
jgi:hypothetical protein